MVKLKYSVLLFLISIGIVTSLSGQNISSGEYENGLDLAFDPKLKMLTGYFNNSSGFDESTGQPRFVCSFFLITYPKQKNVPLLSLEPLALTEQGIDGELTVYGGDHVNIKLKEEHGGCWNVMHFTGKGSDFKLNKAQKWIQIRGVISEKAYFHKKPMDNQRSKAYLIKGDPAYIEQIQGDWAFCIFYGKKITKGWIKLSDLNM